MSSVATCCYLTTSRGRHGVTEGYREGPPLATPRPGYAPSGSAPAPPGHAPAPRRNVEPSGQSGALGGARARSVSGDVALAAASRFSPRHPRNAQRRWQRPRHRGWQEMARSRGACRSMSNDQIGSGFLSRRVGRNRGFDLVSDAQKLQNVMSLEKEMPRRSVHRRGDHGGLGVALASRSEGARVLRAARRSRCLE